MEVVTPNVKLNAKPTSVYAFEIVGPYDLFLVISSIVMFRKRTDT